MSKLTVDPSLRDWYLVDALDGRRWIGRVWIGRIPENEISGSEIPLLEDEIILQPAFEVPPDRALGLMVSVEPMLDPKTMVMVPTPQPQAVTLATQKIAPIFDIEKNGTPPQRVRRCSLARLSDWSADARANLVRGLEEAVKRAASEICVDGGS